MRANQLQATTNVDRRHQTWAFIFYLSAVILPLGSLLIVLRWMYLRHHLRGGHRLHREAVR
jgi:hypothetical protein